ncbi:MAG: helix-turn-helix transcriptional regulator, partial [Thermomicrobiales bacterium]|nr:helix-turn-helix transcriptional regulator [Thermomicrobiales bacterium]
MLMMEDRTLALARAVRARRQSLGLSLDELSARSAVSKGAIVSLENGEANPTFGTIVRVADALQTPVSALFEAVETAPARVISPAAQPCLWQGPLGGCARLLLTVPGAAPVEYWAWSLHPGEAYVSHPHPPGVQEVITVASGRLLLTLGDEQREIPAGALVLFSADRSHSYAAVSDPC